MNIINEVRFDEIDPNAVATLSDELGQRLNQNGMLDSDDLYSCAELIVSQDMINRKHGQQMTPDLVLTHLYELKPMDNSNIDENLLDQTAAMLAARYSTLEEAKPIKPMKPGEEAIGRQQHAMANRKSSSSHMSNQTTSSTHMSNQTPAQQNGEELPFGQQAQQNQNQQGGQQNGQMVDAHGNPMVDQNGNPMADPNAGVDPKAQDAFDPDAQEAADAEAEREAEGLDQGEKAQAFLKRAGVIESYLKETVENMFKPKSE